MKVLLLYTVTTSLLLMSEVNFRTKNTRLLEIPVRKQKLIQNTNGKYPSVDSLRNLSDSVKLILPIERLDLSDSILIRISHKPDSSLISSIKHSLADTNNFIHSKNKSIIRINCGVYRVSQTQFAVFAMTFKNNGDTTAIYTNYRI